MTRALRTLGSSPPQSGCGGDPRPRAMRQGGVLPAGATLQAGCLGGFDLLSAIVTLRGTGLQGQSVSLRGQPLGRKTPSGSVGPQSRTDNGLKRTQRESSELPGLGVRPSGAQSPQGTCLGGGWQGPRQGREQGEQLPGPLSLSSALGSAFQVVPGAAGPPPPAPSVCLSLSATAHPGHCREQSDWLPGT